MLVPLHSELQDNLDVFGDDVSPLVGNSRRFTLHALLTKLLGGSVDEHREHLAEAAAAARLHDDAVMLRDLTRLGVCAEVVLGSDEAGALLEEARSHLPDPDDVPRFRYEAVAVINAGLAIAMLDEDARAVRRWRDAQHAQPVGPHLVGLIVEMLFLSRADRPLASTEAAYLAYEAAIEGGDMMAPLLAGLASAGAHGGDLWGAISAGIAATDADLFPIDGGSQRAIAKGARWSARDQLKLVLPVEGDGGPITAPAPLLVPFVVGIPSRLRALAAGDVRVGQILGLRKRADLHPLLTGRFLVEIHSDLPVRPEQPWAYEARLAAGLEWARASIDDVDLTGTLAFEFQASGS